ASKRKGEQAMTAATQTTWLEMNQRYLNAGIGYIRALLEWDNALVHDTEPDDQAMDTALTKMAAIAGAMSAPPALERLRTIFGLSVFETQIVLLCAAMEFDADIARLCAAAHTDPNRACPTFGLAFASLPSPHWSALAVSAPLRRWRLVEVGSGHALMRSPLR